MVVAPPQFLPDAPRVPAVLGPAVPSYSCGFSDLHCSGGVTEGDAGVLGLLPAALASHLTADSAQCRVREQQLVDRRPHDQAQVIAWADAQEIGATELGQPGDPEGARAKHR